MLLSTHPSPCSARRQRLCHWQLSQATATEVLEAETKPADHASLANGHANGNGNGKVVITPRVLPSVSSSGASNNPMVNLTASLDLAVDPVAGGHIETIAATSSSSSRQTGGSVSAASNALNSLHPST